MALLDSFNRIHDYLRISLTDQCNLRCAYCMPHEDIDFLPPNQLMQSQEIIEIAKVFVELGVNKIRLTGGEPLVRKDFREIALGLSVLPVSMMITSNGILIEKHLETLKQAKIQKINISLDTLSREKFKQIAKREQFDQVWKNIHLLLQENFSVKLNVVLMRGINDHELYDFIDLTKEMPLHVRFIEFMPFDQNGWNKKLVITHKELKDEIEARYDCIKLPDLKHDTAKKYKVVGSAGSFAFITTMSAPFCGDCNRIRLTADGKIKNCLFGKEELDLLSAHRSGQDIRSIITTSIQRKHAMMGGQFKNSYENTNPEKIENRSMIKIGG